MDQSGTFDRRRHSRRADEASLSNTGGPGHLRTAQIDCGTGVRNREIGAGLSAVLSAGTKKRLRRMDLGQHRMELETAIPSATARKRCWQPVKDVVNAGKKHRIARSSENAIAQLSGIPPNPSYQDAKFLVFVTLTELSPTGCQHFHNGGPSFLTGYIYRLISVTVS